MRGRTLALMPQPSPKRSGHCNPVRRIIGLDLDNTIACYDGVIEALAPQHITLPAGFHPNKIALRDYLRSVGREDDWTSFQGHLYGPGMELAAPYPGAVDAIRRLIATGYDVTIISHRTRHPYRGPAFDLHGAAARWIDRHLVGEDGNALLNGRIHLHEHRADKIAAIGQLNCETFVDDLLDVLTDSAFPGNCRRIWFTPGSGGDTTEALVARSWADVLRICL